MEIYSYDVGEPISPETYYNNRDFRVSVRLQNASDTPITSDIILVRIEFQDSFILKITTHTLNFT